LVKSLKAFSVYVLHSRFIVYVPSTYVKGILIHPDIDEIRSKWISKILEFEIEIKPTKLVKAQCLARLLDKYNCKYLGVNFINTFSENKQVELSNKDSQVSPTLAECAWYKDIIFVMQNLQPPDGMKKNKVRDLNLKSIRYCLIDQVLYWKDPLGVILRCLDPQEAQRIMFDFHDSLCGGHNF
jgi:hypothetical protein